METTSKISRQLLLVRLLDIINTQPKDRFKGIRRELAEFNAPESALSMLRMAPFSQSHRTELTELAKRSAHLRHYNAEFTVLSNALYAEITVPINRGIIWPILKKYMAPEDIPFNAKPTELFPNPLMTHCDTLLFDSIEQAQGAMAELEPHVVFDWQREVPGRGYAVGYELKEWNRQIAELREAFSASILD